MAVNNQEVYNTLYDEIKNSGWLYDSIFDRDDVEIGESRTWNSSTYDISIDLSRPQRDKKVYDFSFPSDWDHNTKIILEQVKMDLKEEGI